MLSILSEKKAEAALREKINEIENNESLDNLTKNLDKYNMLVFASKNTAAYFFKSLNTSDLILIFNPLII